MSKPLVYRRLYRSLLKASKPFCGSSPDATYISCLLHRTGIDDGVDWETLAAIKVEEAKLDEQAKNSRPLHEARDLSKSYAQPDSSNSDDDATAALKNSLAERKEPERVLFRRLLREVVAGSTSGLKQMQFPKQVDKEALTNVIKREFRLSDHIFDIETRQQVGFLALRELNKKLSRLDELQLEQDVNLDEEGVKLRNQRQAAKHVSPLPLEPKEYLVPGSFLLAHPLLTGYFRRTVICILDHTERSADSDGGTYGLIVNRIGVSPKTGKDQTLQDVLRTIPPQLLDSFGECAVRDGGPVHMSLQMIHSAQENGKVGGTLLQMLTEDKERSVALHTDRAIYYQGDIVHAAGAVKSGELERDDVCFYAGASCWELRQLESEIERGFWMPCRGPPEIALTGVCEHSDQPDSEGEPRPKADLWLSMMCSMGQDEANLAHLLLHDDFVDNGEPCDSF